MALTFLSIQTQFGALLQMLRKWEARWEHATRADGSTFDRRLLTQTNGFTTTDTEESRALGRLLNLLDTAQASRAAAGFTGLRTEIENLLGFFGVIDADSAVINDDDREASPIAIQYIHSVVGGVVSIRERIGILGALRREMEQAGEFVVANGVTFAGGDIVAAFGNSGLLTATTMIGDSHTLTGDIVLTCINESVSAPKFSVEIDRTNDLVGLGIIEADEDVTAEQAYTEGISGLTLLLTRSGLAAPVESGDDGNMFASSTIETPADTDMNSGVLQVKVTRNASAPDFTIEFFNNSARSTKVGEVTVTGVTGTTPIDKTLNNGTRFQSTFSKVNAAAALLAGQSDNDISFDIKTPRLGDRWTRGVVNDEAGEFSSRVAHGWRLALPTSGSSQWTDSLAAPVSVL